MRGRDLGTYFVRVEFLNRDGFIMQWDTGARYTNGSGSFSPLNAKRIEPYAEDEEFLAESVKFMFSEGNYACDCNRAIFLARARQEAEPEEPECGESAAFEIAKLTLIRPDGSEVLLYEPAPEV
jgi:hypothetical protein